jgi:tricorn protease
MRWNGRIVFVSDRDGVANLWSMERDGRDPRQHTRHRDFEVRGASLSGNRVAYQHGADIRVFDLVSGADRVVALQLTSDFDQQRERWVRRPLTQFSGVSLAANGERALVVARGRAVSVAPGALRRINIATPANSRVRFARFMPDGKSVLVICDISGEMEVWRFPADGSGPGTQLTRGADTLRWGVFPSPDGHWIAHDDRKQRLWLLNVETGEERQLDQGEAFGSWNFSDIRWAPDSSALVARVAQVSNQGRTALVLYRIADGHKVALTSHRFSNFSPAFSPDGRWLWFLSNRNFEPQQATPWGERNMGPFFDRRTRAYAISLQAGNRFPFQVRDELMDLKPAALAPGDEAAKPAPAAPAARGRTPPIEWEGLAQRLFEAPLPAGNYTRLDTEGRRLWFLEEDPAAQRRTALRYLTIDNSGVAAQTYQSDIRQFALSGDGRRLLLRRWTGGVGDMYLVDVGLKPPPPADLARAQLRLADWQFTVEPREDWQQIFGDAWRMQRDWFYDPAMHGVDWPALRRKYEVLLPRVTDRAELTDLIAQMLAELKLMHSQVRSGEQRSGEDDVRPAVLGAALDHAPGAASGGVRITRVYTGDPELIETLPPLARPGIAARAGEVIVALDRQPVSGLAQLGAALRDKAGRQVLLGLQGENGETRDVVVTPAPAARESEFKRRDWVWNRRERVESASGGRFGYLHLRAMGAADLAEFARDFYPVLDREGLIIDVRQNSGGNIDSIIIEKLMRRAWTYMQDRNGRRIWNMQGAFRGHIVVLIDAGTYSDGEAFAEGMRRLGLATLLGKRTAGAGVWLTNSTVQVDGGMARAAEQAQLSLDGEWLIEGKGVAPDIEVDNPPHATFKGEDAQLAAAIRVLREKLAARPIRTPPATPYPRVDGR